MFATAWPPLESDVGRLPLDQVGSSLDAVGPAIRTYDPGLAAIATLVVLVALALIATATWFWPDKLEESASPKA